MKIVCIIDSLGSGGAQRQMVNLISGLVVRNYDVDLLIYHESETFYLNNLKALNINILSVKKKMGFSLRVVFFIYKTLQNGRYNSVVSFLDASNIYSILANLMSIRKYNLIISERSCSYAKKRSLYDFLKFRLYFFADKIVCNSHHNAEFIKKKYFWLRKKVFIIYNGYIIPKIDTLFQDRERSEIILLVAGRFNSGKNGIRLLQALILFHIRNGYVPFLYWAGRKETDDESINYINSFFDIIDSHPYIKDKWIWLGERTDLEKYIVYSDALIHVSLYEGLPNVVCEALLLGRPVIISDVCDHKLLVKENLNGILCNPLSPLSICMAIEKFCEFDEKKRYNISINSRYFAVKNLELNLMINQYEKLI
jgi:glycosyltransferase involved in cell wall biosynthesis